MDITSPDCLFLFLQKWVVDDNKPSSRSDILTFANWQPGNSGGGSSDPLLK